MSYKTTTPLGGRRTQEIAATLEVLAELRLHPKDQAKLEQLTSRISLEKGVSAVSWVVKPLELVTD